MRFAASLLLATVCLACAAPSPVVPASARLPPPIQIPGTGPWRVIGEGKNDYRVELDPSAAWNDRATWHMARGGSMPNEPAWMLSDVLVAAQRGQRVRIDLDVRTQGEPGQYEVRAQTRAGRSTGPLVHTAIEPIAGFRHATLVLDVPEGTDTIEVGAGATSPGEISIADTAMTVVDPGTELTMKPPVVLGGWHLMGTARAAYEASLDPAGARAAATVPIHVHAVSRPFPSYAAAAFEVAPSGPHHGERLRISFWVRTVGAVNALCETREERGTSWTPRGRELSTHPEHLPPTSDWHQCTSELVVLGDSGSLMYGVVLRGTGDVWIEEPTVTTIVPPSTPSHSL